ncbi:lysoplasmalogenase family protein [Sandarakinorhabdus rubra]|uniref:lysoplasmalogenase family protein n=1 Tax=Sandarakinorhabdus rubra TaxID=2672568 RepID=UPI0013DD708D|nr:lysoplasmalogenase family protein [Sandarakinorhabdus rubra]
MPSLVASLPLAGLPLRFRLPMAAALMAGLAWLLLEPVLAGPVAVAVKGSGVALIALAALQLPASGARWLATIMALGAAGDMLLEVKGLFIAGAACFALGHVAAMLFYARHRRGTSAMDRLLAAAMVGYGLVMPPLISPVAVPYGLAMVYAVLLTGMAASLWLSRFPKLALAGALGFVLSDTLLVYRMGGGALIGGAADSALVWILYFAGQWLIALGVARGLLARQAHG